MRCQRAPMFDIFTLFGGSAWVERKFALHRALARAPERLNFVAAAERRVPRPATARRLDTKPTQHARRLAAWLVVDLFGRCHSDQDGESSTCQQRDFLEHDLIRRDARWLIQLRKLIAPNGGFLNDVRIARLGPYPRCCWPGRKVTQGRTMRHVRRRAARPTERITPPPLR
jgi:hypothetical protein